jgi:hypothetical protein
MGRIVTRRDRVAGKHGGVSADRLEAWLCEGNALPSKGRRQDVATEIGVTREALYRELSRRRKRLDPGGDRNVVIGKA